MTRVFVLAAALAACAPVHRVARPHQRTPDWALEGDFALVCIAGAATAATFNAPGERVPFVLSFGSFLGLIALDTWAAR